MQQNPLQRELNQAPNKKHGQFAHGPVILLPTCSWKKRECTRVCQTGGRWYACSLMYSISMPA